MELWSNTGGCISCYSKPDEGSTFTIYLPIFREIDGKSPIARIDIVPKGSETILLVDDEDSVVDVGCRFLSNAGYNILTAKDGLEALEVYHNEKNKIDLVILDLIMPKMTGQQCLVELRKLDPNIKIIISSGYSENQILDEVKTLRIDSFVQKPFNMNQLLTTVRYVLDGGKL